MKNKILSIMTALLVLTLALTVATPVKATVEADKYGKVEITGGSTGTVSGSQEENTVVVVKEANLKWVAADPSVGRNVDGYWIGVKITAPSGIDATKSKMTRTGATKTFDSIKDGSDYAGLWVRVDENKLAAATDELVLQNYKFTWVKTTSGSEDTVTTQNLTVKVKVDKEKIKLDKEGTVEVKVGGKTFTLTKGKSLNDLTDKEKATLAELKKAPKGKKFVAFVDEKGNVVKESAAINVDVKLTAKFEKVEAKKKSKDPTPNTGVDVYAVAGAILVVSALGVVALSKRN